MIKLIIRFKLIKIKLKMNITNKKQSLMSQTYKQRNT